jgi:hypothetical protein
MLITDKNAYNPNSKFHVEQATSLWNVTAKHLIRVVQLTRNSQFLRNEKDMERGYLKQAKGLNAKGASEKRES